MLSDTSSIIVVCTRNRSDDLVRLIKSLIEHGGGRLLLCVDSSDEMTFFKNRKSLENYGNFKHLSIEPGLTFQRNTALDLMKDSFSRELEFVHFMDDDTEIYHNYFESLESALQIEGIAGVTGIDLNMVNQKPSRLRIMLGLDSSTPGAISKFGIPRQVSGYPTNLFDVKWLSGCSMSYRWSSIQNERFDTRLKGYGLAEDLWFSYRLTSKHRLVCQPDATYRHFLSPLNRLEINQRNLCEKSHRRTFMQTYDSFNARDFLGSIFLEQIFLLAKILLLRNSKECWTRFKSNLKVLRMHAQIPEGLFCSCATKTI